MLRAAVRPSTTAVNTTISNNGIEHVDAGGTAQNVSFSGEPGAIFEAILELATPSGLEGTIANFKVGDVIDFLKTDVTFVQQTGDTLTVFYAGNQTASYTLAGQQANTEFHLQSDGHGGTDLILTLGVEAHIGPGPGIHFV